MMTISDRTSNKIRNMGVLCMLFILMIHCYPQFPRGSFSFWLGELTVGGLCHIAVPFFFVVSVFFVGRKIQLGNLSDTYWSVVRRRVKSLAVPYVIWLGLFWLTVNFAGNALRVIHGDALSVWIPTLRQCGLHVGGGIMLESLWYVRSVLIFVLIAPVLFWIGLRIGTKRFLVVLFLAYGILCPWRPLPEWGGVQDVTRCGILSVLGLFYFSAGLFLGNGMVSDIGLRRKEALFLLFGGCVMIVCRAFLSYKNIPCSYYLGFLSLPCLLYGFYWITPASCWPVWITRNVFAVFLLHGLLFYAFRRSGLIPASNWFVIIFVITGTYAFASCIVELARRSGGRVLNIMLGGR